MLTTSLTLNLLLPEDGASHDPCTETYCGPSAGSEPETKAVSAELNRIGSSAVAKVSLHSFGQKLLIPWGNHVGYVGTICERAEDYDELVCAI